MSIAEAPPGPAPAAKRATFTLAQYEHMVACGAFEGENKQRLEFLWGEIVEMAPIGPPHSDDVDKLLVWSIQANAGKPIRVRAQGPIRLPECDSEPEPDVAWVVERSYRERHPNPDEVLLLIEVANSSLEVDRGPKLAAYAQAGIAEYWIVNLRESQLEVYREPRGQAYAQRRDVKPGESVSPLAAPDAVLEVAPLFAAEGQ